MYITEEIHDDSLFYVVGKRSRVAEKAGEESMNSFHLSRAVLNDGSRVEAIVEHTTASAPPWSVTEDR